MIGGLSKAASRLTLAAVLGAVGAIVFVQKPVRAADLGGDCCADLEERVAELEATTVRKGNKKVSVQIYGKVNWAELFWNDGHEQSNYSVNNYMESTRFGFKGSAKIGGDWSAGYRLEAEVREGASQFLNQFNDNNNPDVQGFGPLNVRWSQLYLANKNWGEVRWGLTATPKYDVTKDTLEYISTESGEGGGLSDTMVADFRMNDSFLLREKGFNNAEGLAGVGGGRALTWSNIARCYGSGDQFNCSTRRNGVAYWSPTWQGFSASGAGSRTMTGVQLCAIGTPSPTPGPLPRAPATRNCATSGCNSAAADWQALNATYTRSRARPPSRTNPLGCSSWASGASPTPTTRMS